jgi:carbamoyltransferase
LQDLGRIKLWHGVPHLAIKEALEIAGISFTEIDFIATHEKTVNTSPEIPFYNKIRIIENSNLTQEIKDVQIAALKKRQEHEYFVRGERTPGFLNEIGQLGKAVESFSHHQAHAAASFYGSGWGECIVLTADGWGEDGSSTLWQGKDGKLAQLSFSHTFDSLGYFYGSITKSLGFTPHRHEGKILGLAAYCDDPKSYSQIRSMIDYNKDEKRFVGNMENGLYIPNFQNPRLDEFVKKYKREDVAASAQKSLEEVVCQCVSSIKNSSFKIALCGGIFANVKLNQRIREIEKVEDVFVYPNMGDGGLSIGSAYLAYHLKTNKTPTKLTTALLGYEITNDKSKVELEKSKLIYHYYDNIAEIIGEKLADRKVVAVANGKMEYGPRALGNRSLMFHAGDKSVNDWLNHCLNRSEFMPFAPATLDRFAKDCYKNIDLNSQPNKYMIMTYDCTEKMQHESPAAVHVDATARPQILSQDQYPFFYDIVESFYKITGLSTVINTSFNMHEEPIVRTEKDAIKAFKASKLPYLALGNYLVEQASDFS